MTASPLAATARWATPLRGRAAIALFLAFIGVPLLGTVANLFRGPVTVQNWHHLPPPAWPRSFSQALHWPGNFRAYFLNDYASKETLRELHGQLEVKLLGTSSSPAVLLGKSGWLFFASEQALEGQRGANPLSPAELSQWSRTLLERQQQLAGRGIRYGFVVTPNTHTIYSEFLPDTVPQGVTRLSQLAATLPKAAPSVNFIDLRAVLLASKPVGRLYFKTDTHWTAAAAWLATQEISRRLDLPVSSYPLLPVRSTPAPAGDLARLLGMSAELSDANLWPAEPQPQLLEEDGKPLSFMFQDVEKRERVVVENPAGQGTALIFRDSFAEALMPWLSAKFRRTVWMFTYRYDSAVVEAEHPDVVIEQVVERRLMTIQGPGGGNVLK